MDGQKPGVPEENQASVQPVPGQTIQPGQQTAPQQVPDAPTSNTTVASEAVPEPSTASAAGGFFRNQQDGADYAAISASDYEEPSFSPDDIVEWTASEFVAHHKTGGWYFLLILLSVSVAALIWFTTRDIVSPVVVILAGIILGSYASRKPRQLQYRADPSGLTIGERYYSFNDFKAFTVVHEGAFSSLVFYPMQRFGLVVTVYYDPGDEERIFSLVSQRIPYDETKHDPIENLMRRIRF